MYYFSLVDVASVRFTTGAPTPDLPKLKAVTTLAPLLSIEQKSGNKCARDETTVAAGGADGANVKKIFYFLLIYCLC